MEIWKAAARADGIPFMAYGKGRTLPTGPQIVFTQQYQTWQFTHIPTMSTTFFSIISYENCGLFEIALYFFFRIIYNDSDIV